MEIRKSREKKTFPCSRSFKIICAKLTLAMVSLGTDGIHPQVLRKMANVIAKPHSIILERSQSAGDLPEDWRKVNVTSVFKKGREGGPKKI